MAYAPLQLAEAFIRAGELVDALEALDAHLEAQPGDDEARRLRVSVQRRIGGDDHLRAALADLAALTQPSADDRAQESVLYYELEDWPAACRALQAACALRPGDERLTERLVWLLEKGGDLAGARALAEAQTPSWRWAQTAGDLAREQNDLAGAGRHYRTALADFDARSGPGSAFMAHLRQQIADKLAGVEAAARS